MKKNKEKKINSKKEAILIKKHEYEVEIDALYEEKKKYKKDKAKRKEINKQIANLKHLRSRVGKKDTYLSDVYEEMRLVRWPNKKEILKYSLASLAFVAFFAAFFYLIDVLFSLVKGIIG